MLLQRRREIKNGSDKSKIRHKWIATHLEEQFQEVLMLLLAILLKQL